MPGKVHCMIQDAAEMRLVMGFWAERLGRRPVPTAAGLEEEDLIEVSS